MENLSYSHLMEAYRKAIELKLNENFLSMLKNEIIKRESATLEQSSNKQSSSTKRNILT